MTIPFGCGPDQYAKHQERDQKWIEQEEERAHAERMLERVPSAAERNQLLEEAIQRIAQLEVHVNDSEMRLAAVDERLRRLEQDDE